MPKSSGNHWSNVDQDSDSSDSSISVLSGGSRSDSGVEDGEWGRQTPPQENNAGGVAALDRSSSESPPGRGSAGGHSSRSGTPEDNWDNSNNRGRRRTPSGSASPASLSHGSASPNKSLSPGGSFRSGSGSRSPSESRGSRSPSGTRGSRSPSGSVGSRSPSGSIGSRSPSGSRDSRSPADNRGSRSRSGSRGSQSPSGSRASRSRSGSRASGSPGGSRASGSPGGSRASGSPGGSRASGSPGGSRASGSPGGSRASGSRSGSRGSQSPSGSRASRSRSGSRGSQSPSGSRASRSHSGSRAGGSPAGSRGSRSPSISRGSRSPSGSRGSRSRSVSRSPISSRGSRSRSGSRASRSTRSSKSRSRSRGSDRSLSGSRSPSQKRQRSRSNSSSNDSMAKTAKTSHDENGFGDDSDNSEIGRKRKRIVISDDDEPIDETKKQRVQNGEEVEMDDLFGDAGDISEEEGAPKEDEPPPETRIDAEIPKINTDLGKEIHFVKLPNFLSVETRPFYADMYEDEIDDEETLDEEGRARVKLKVENTIRWRTKLDRHGNEKKESNSKMVRWSDGSMSLHLGSEIFDIYKQPLQGDHNHLFIRQGTGLQGQAVFRTKLSFRPHSTDSFTHRKITLSLADRSLKASGVKVMSQITKDPELQRNESLRRDEDRLKASCRRETKQRRVREKAAQSQLSAGFLEDDDDDGISLAAIKNQYKNNPRDAAPIYSSDEEASDIETVKANRIKRAKRGIRESDEENDASSRESRSRSRSSSAGSRSTSASSRGSRSSSAESGKSGHSSPRSKKSGSSSPGSRASKSRSRSRGGSSSRSSSRSRSRSSSGQRSKSGSEGERSAAPSGSDSE